MPSRTYIQMYMETGRYNYFLKDRLYYVYLLRNAYAYLCKHPEKVEDVVRWRVRVGKFATVHNSFEWLFLEIQLINTWIAEDDKMPSRGTMYAIPVKSEYFSPDVRIDNANPVYIPKHIQHRKKGRR